MDKGCVRELLSNIHPECTLGATNHSYMDGDCPECNALAKIDNLTKANKNLLKAINVLGEKIIELEQKISGIANDTKISRIANDTNLPFPDCGRLPE